MTVLRNSRVSRISRSARFLLGEVYGCEQRRVPPLMVEALEIDGDIHHAAVRF